MMKLPHFVILTLNFAGGPLKITLGAQTRELCQMRRILAPGHGTIVISSLFPGPKEWSPFGLTDKAWIEIFRIPAGISHFTAEYVTVSGDAQVRVDSWFDSPFVEGVVFFCPTLVLAAKKP